MKADIKQIRKDIRQYRRKFNKTYRKIYGVPFRSYVTGLELYLKAIADNGNYKTLATEAWNEYKGRILRVKAQLEHHSTANKPL